MKYLILLLALLVSQVTSAVAGGLVAGTRGSKIWNYPVRYWGNVADSLSRSFSSTATPAAVWIVTFYGDGGDTYATFPSGGATVAHVSFTSTDFNEAYLTEFDRRGMRVWLQIEPGAASVSDLIDVVLSRYKNHKCVTGFGIDVEWLDAQSVSEGRRVTDAEASAWEQKVKSYDPAYTLFLKHYTQNRMPLTYRGDILFVDDSQQFPGFASCVNEFKVWGQSFPANKVAFQFGYPDDRPWWSLLQNPPVTLGNALLAAIPNTAGLFWVDFTISEVFSIVANGVAGLPAVPEILRLQQNYPNPFNPTTTIRYSLPESGTGEAGLGAEKRDVGNAGSGGSGLGARVVRLAVYDILGREVAVLVNEPKATGEYSVTWDARGMSSGVYYYRLEAGEFVQLRKMVVVK
jgi:hypothetical protein